MNIKTAKYPKLANWFRNSSHRTSLNSDEALIVFETCRILNSDCTHLVLERWGQTLAKTFGGSKNPDTLFLQVEELLKPCDTTFSEILSEIVLAGISIGEGELIIGTMSQLADQTRLVAFRFLAAWSALNIDDFERCIKECENVDQPFAPIYTIQGQALIEMGRVNEAIEILQVAAKLAPRDVLAWFQLAKAYYLVSSEMCWDALVTCQQLAPSNLEVAGFLAISALSEVPADEAKCAIAYESLSPHLLTAGYSSLIYTHLFRLSLFSKNRQEAMLLAKEINCRRIYLEKDFLSHLPQILTQLQTLEWNSVSCELLSD